MFFAPGMDIRAEGRARMTRHFISAAVIFLVAVTFLRPAQAGWEVVGTPGFSESEIEYTALALDNGEPYVAYRDVSYSSLGKATVMRFDGTSWQTVGSSGFSPGNADILTLAVHNGCPYLAFRDTTNRCVRVMHYQGSWTSLGASLDGTYPSMALLNGIPYVALSDATNRLAVFRFTGGSWQQVGTTSPTDHRVSYTSIAFWGDSPCVAYRDTDAGGRASVVMYTDGAWQTLGTAGFSAGAATRPSLAFGNGTLYVTYQDAAYGNKATVMSYVDGSWQTVGTPGFSAGAAYRVSIGFCNGEPYVGYQDGGNGNKATVMRFTGGSWQPVGAAGFTSAGAWEMSFAVDNCVPYVAYQDPANDYFATVMRYAAQYSTDRVTNVTAVNANGTYGLGDTIGIQVVFSGNVTVTGTPQLTLATTPPRTIGYTSGSGTNTLLFNYVVAAGNFAADLDYAGTAALVLSGGTIKDTEGLDIRLTLPAPGGPGSLGYNKDITIDARIPGDYDHDGDVDKDDLEHFSACVLGPAVPQNDPNCANAKFDLDDDVDQDDFGVWQKCFSGDGIPGRPNCAD